MTQMASRTKIIFIMLTTLAPQLAHAHPNTSKQEGHGGSLRLLEDADQSDTALPPGKAPRGTMPAPQTRAAAARQHSLVSG